MRDLGWLWRWGKLVLANPGAFAAILVAGALASFAYSYVPLHSAKNWKIEYLEARLSAEREQAAELEQELAGARSLAESRPDAEVLESLRRELEEARARVVQLGREGETSRARIESLKRSRNDWKTRHAALEAARSRVVEVPAEVAPEVDSKPAAPAPTRLDFEDSVEPAGSAGSADGTPPDF